jgi:hypothetical protein
MICIPEGCQHRKSIVETESLPSRWDGHVVSRDSGGISRFAGSTTG